jgi:GNAT superfamily N-acetyltransferase
MYSHPLAPILAATARNQFPPPDGSVVFLPKPPHYAGVVAAFTGHTIIATDVPSEELADRLTPCDLAAPVSPAFLHWLGQRLGVAAWLLDAVLVHVGGGDAGLSLVERTDLAQHPRVALALSKRANVRVFSDKQGRGFVALGIGLVGRWEVSFEVEETARDAGLGRALLAAGRALVPPGQPVFAQVTPGNARSLRSILAAGFRPIGSEVLFHEVGNRR